MSTFRTSYRQSSTNVWKLFRNKLLITQPIRRSMRFSDLSKIHKCTFLSTHGPTPHHTLVDIVITELMGIT